MSSPVKVDEILRRSAPLGSLLGGSSAHPENPYRDWRELCADHTAAAMDVYFGKDIYRLPSHTPVGVQDDIRAVLATEQGPQLLEPFRLNLSELRDTPVHCKVNDSTSFVVTLV